MQYCELMMVFRFDDRNGDPSAHLRKILERGYFYNSSSTSVAQHLELSFLIADNDNKLEVTNHLIDEILLVIPDSELVSMSTIKSVSFASKSLQGMEINLHNDDKIQAR